MNSNHSIPFLSGLGIFVSYVIMWPILTTTVTAGTVLLLGFPILLIGMIGGLLGLGFNFNLGFGGIFVLVAWWILLAWAYDKLDGWDGIRYYLHL